MASPIRIDVSPPKRYIGEVFFVGRNSGFGRCDDHYSVVLLPDVGDDCLVLGVITSQVEKRVSAARASGFAEESVVRISPREYRELKKESAIDCNSVKRMTRTFFDTISSHARKCMPLPKSICLRLLDGIAASDNNSASLRQLAHSMKMALAS